MILFESKKITIELSVMEIAIAMAERPTHSYNGLILPPQIWEDSTSDAYDNSVNLAVEDLYQLWPHVCVHSHVLFKINVDMLVFSETRGSIHIIIHIYNIYIYSYPIITPNLCKGFL